MSNMKKMVLKVALENEKSKKRALKAVAGVGVESVVVDLREGKVTVIGDADPVWLIVKMRKFVFAELLSVGPAKEEKKEAEKKMVFRVALENEKSKIRIMRAVAGVGVESVAVDLREGKVTVIGDADPVWLVVTMRKFGFAELLSVGPAKEEKKEAEKRMEAAAGFRGTSCAIEDARSKERIIETVAGFYFNEQYEVESIAVDLREGKMTVIGDADPVHLTVKIRKLGFSAELVSVGPAKEEKKKRMEAAAGFRGTSCAIEDARSKERIIETVAGFGDFTSMSNMKKMVFRVVLWNEKSKERFMTAVAAVGGVRSIVDLREGNMIVIGDADPVLLTVNIRKFGVTELLSVGPATELKKEAEQRMEAAAGFRGMNWAIEDARSKEKIIETVAGFGDFTSIEVDVQKGMVTVVGKSVPVCIALKVRELGYRAKLVSVGSAEEDGRDQI